MSVFDVWTIFFWRFCHLYFGIYHQNKLFLSSMLNCKQKNKYLHIKKAIHNKADIVTDYQKQINQTDYMYSTRKSRIISDKDIQKLAAYAYLAKYFLHSLDWQLAIVTIWQMIYTFNFTSILQATTHYCIERLSVNLNNPTTVPNITILFTPHQSNTNSKGGSIHFTIYWNSF